MLMRDGLGRGQHASEGQGSRTEAFITAQPDFNAQAHEKDYVRKILVPTNFSPCAECAFRRALALAEQCHASITLLYVVDVSGHMPGWGPADPAKVTAEFRQKGADQFQAIISSMPDRRVEVNTLILEGLPRDVIAETARDYDLIVIGRGMRKPFWRLFSRRTFTGVLDSAPCPLVVVNDGKDERMNLTKPQADGINTLLAGLKM